MNAVVMEKEMIYDYKTNPVKAIREKCLNDCCAGDRNEVENCLCPTCPLFPFRMGKNPFRKEKVLNDEQKEKLINRLKAGKEQQN